MLVQHRQQFSFEALQLTGPQPVAVGQPLGRNCWDRCGPTRCVFNAPTPARAPYSSTVLRGPPLRLTGMVNDPPLPPMGTGRSPAPEKLKRSRCRRVQR
ncbi:MAG: hypothetical protein NTV57_15785 [Cyanobacteria bacterium]|nr:hypothetical protein [Cyanobacteriota bacterium]